jgi:hypothetical protein
VLTVLRALAANDDRIIDYFRSINQGRKIYGRVVEFEIDNNIAIHLNTDDFVSSIELALWSRIAKLAWRPFEEAREFVRRLNIENKDEWTKYYKGQLPEKGIRPEDIPTAPSRTYKGRGWLSWGDWFGTGSVAPWLRKFCSFEEAREFVVSLNIKNKNEWSKYCRGQLPEKGMRPEDIPTSPAKTYKDEGWKGWGDWLGTGAVANFNKQFRPFEEARIYVRSLRLKSGSEWRRFTMGELPDKGMLPQDIPAAPMHVYQGQGWVSMGDWLGSEVVASQLRQYRAFEEARKYARSLGLKSISEWRKFSKGDLPEKGMRPKDIPGTPNRVYKERGWKGMGDWLGTGAVAPQLREFRSFEEARTFIHNLSINSLSEWKKYCKGQLQNKEVRPEDIPTNPNVVYNELGWKNWGDWFGTGAVAPQLREYRPFEEARAYVRSLQLKNQEDWKKYCKGHLPRKGLLPNDIPYSPDKVYQKQGWKGMGDWLGTGTVANINRKFRPYEEARAYVRGLGLKNETEWRKFCKGILPDKGYLPNDIPSNPNQVYKDDWKGKGDWLGTGRVRRANTISR